MKTTKIVLPIAALALALTGAAACTPDYDADTRTGEIEVSPDARMAQRDARPGAQPGAQPGIDAEIDRRAGEPALGERPMDPMAEQTLEGKLVVENETARTFTIEGETGRFVAPTTANLDTLDGTEVTVHIDDNGRVTSIERQSDRES